MRDFQLSTNVSGPSACLEGELAFHVDISLSGVVTEHLLSAGLVGLPLQVSLEWLRLNYWQKFNDCTELWINEQERQQFTYEIYLRSAHLEFAKAEVLALVFCQAERDAQTGLNGNYG